MKDDPTLQDKLRLNRRGFFGAIAAALGCLRGQGAFGLLPPGYYCVPKPGHVAVYDFAIGSDVPTAAQWRRYTCAHCGAKVTIEEAWSHGDCRQREEEGAGEGTVGPVSPPSG